MNNIIEQLYNGNINPIEQHRPAMSEYRSMFSKKAKVFSEKLDPELQKEFDILIDEYSTRFPVEMTEEFTNGFKLAVRIMCEVFSEENEYD